MSFDASNVTAEEWLARASSISPAEIAKTNSETRAWQAILDDVLCFVKFFPAALYESRALKEIQIAGGRLHPAIVPLRQVIRCRDGVLLVNDWAEGTSLSSPEERKRFYRLPQKEKESALATVFAAFAAITEAGWTIVDCYEGNLLYDYSKRTPWLFDFDLYHRGDGFALAMERNYGSRRLMASEEFQKGAWIDQRTNVFNLGWMALKALEGQIDFGSPFGEVLIKATMVDRADRFATVAEFAAAFSANDS